MGFLDKFKFGRLKEGLTKTRENIFGKIRRVLAGKTKIDDELLETIEEILISGDVGTATTVKIIENLRLRVRQDGYDRPADIDSLLREEVERFFLFDPESQNCHPLDASRNKPHVVMLVGVNGVGKTTTVGKLAHNYRISGQSVLIAAADTYRAAANEQLEIWAKRAGVEIIRQARGADPAAVAYDSLNSARARSVDILIIDTAGRLHTRVNLMEELKKIKRVLQKLDAGAPHEILLVLDASTGQNAVVQAKEFAAAVGITGLVLTKLDGTAKGGVVISVIHELSVPVKYIGVGEKINDLQPFDSKAFIDALFEKV